MFTDYRLNKKLSIEKIFDGRLERFDVHETFVAEAKPEWRCLTDGNSVLWVEGDEEIDCLLGFGMFNATEKILTAIEEAFDAQIFSEHQPQFWGNETENEWRRDRLKTAEEGRILPGYLQREFEDYLKCGRLKHGFLRVRCENCHEERLVAFSCKHRGFCPSCGARRMAESAALLVDEVLPHEPIRQWVLSLPFQLRFLLASRPAITVQVLGIVYRVISTHLVKKTGYSTKTARTGAVTLIQRFDSALNLNIHFHMLFLDGMYVDRLDGSIRFRWVSSPTTQELTQLTQTIARRVGRYLERQGLLERDAENSYLTTDAVSEDPMNQLLGHSITYRIALGPQVGRKVFTLQTLPACEPDDYADTADKVSGFSLHAGVAARANERKKLERLSEGGPAVTSVGRRFRKSDFR